MIFDRFDRVFLFLRINYQKIYICIKKENIYKNCGSPVKPVKNEGGLWVKKR